MSLTNPLLNIVLHEPEIPNNTGNIGRTCVGTQSRLHLIEPLGFEITDKQVKRSGLDYWPDLDWRLYPSWTDFRKTVKRPSRMVFFTTKSDRPAYDFEFEPGDFLVFGKETKGLPQEILTEFDAQTLTLPMYGPIRSYNLSNVVAVAAFEAIRQFAAKGLVPAVQKKQ